MFANGRPRAHAMLVVRRGRRRSVSGLVSQGRGMAQGCESDSVKNCAKKWGELGNPRTNKSNGLMRPFAACCLLAECGRLLPFCGVLMRAPFATCSPARQACNDVCLFSALVAMDAFRLHALQPFAFSPLPPALDLVGRLLRYKDFAFSFAFGPLPLASYPLPLVCWVGIPVTRFCAQLRRKLFCYILHNVPLFLDK